MRDSNQLKAGAVISYATQAVHILSGLIYTPVMLRLLGQSEYGLYQLVQSVVSYLSLLSLGFGSGYMRFYARYKVDDDEESIAKLNGIFLLIFSAIALISLLCGSVLIINAGKIFGSGLTDAELYRAKILMTMMIANMAITFINSVFTSNITANERFFFQRAVEFFRTLFNPFLTLPLLILGFGSIGMVAITSFLTVFALVINIRYCFKQLKIKFSFKHLEFKLLRELWVFTFFIFLHMITDQLNWSIDKFLLGRIAGTSAVARYGIASLLNGMYLALSSAVSTVFIPRVNMIAAKNKYDRQLTVLLAKVGRIQFMIVSFVIILYIVFGKEFIMFWAGAGYDSSYYTGIFLMVPVTFFLIQNIGIEIRRALNKHQIPSLWNLVVAFMNLLISIPLIHLFGEIGAGMGTAMALFINIIFINIYYHRVCKLNMLYFWGNIARFFPGVIISVIGAITIKYLLGAGNLFMWIISVCLFTVVYWLTAWIVGMNNEEKSMLKTTIKKLKNRCLN